MTNELVIFDLDGTLFQTQTVDVAAINKALVKNGLPVREPEYLSGLFGLPFPEICRILLQSEDCALTERFAADVTAFEIEEIAREGKLYDGVAESLLRLQALGMTLCICSNGSERYVQEIADKFGFREIFAEISFNQSPLSKAERLGALKRKYAPNTLIVVGDRVSDIEAARSNSAIIIGVSYGFGGDEVLTADYVATDFAEVENLLRGISGRADTDKIAVNSYFTLRKAAEGVWAAIVVPGSGALGNAAIVDLGDAAAVVDTFCLPAAALALREAAEQLTGKPVKYVINTHIHGDHHYGNQVFTDSLIISTGRTRELLAGERTPPPDIWQAGLRKQIAAFAGTKEGAADLRVSAALEDEISDKTGLLAAIPELRRVPAALTFSDELYIHGPARSIKILTFGGGHTESDALVYIEDVKVLIAGDLILHKAHPAMQAGFPEAWIGILAQIGQEIGFERVIPGHGELGGRESLREMAGYLADMLELAKTAAQSGETAEQWLAKGVPAPYNNWRMSHIYEWNLRWLYERFSAREEEVS